MSAPRWIGGALLGLALLLLVWGAAIEPRYLLDVQSHQAEVPNLPPTWEGRTVALLADLQIGMWLGNTGMVEKAVERVVGARPALVLLAGDFVYRPDSAVVRRAVDLVRPLADAGIPILAVLGNHDYSLMTDDGAIAEEMARYLESELEAAGIHVLENEAVPVRAPRGGDPLYVAGLGSTWAKRSRPDLALAGVPRDAARIIFMHNPIAYRALPPHAAPLTLAAHTHGGQMRLPFLRSESWLEIARAREVVAEGWAEDSIGAPGNRLYVNRGIGFSRLPLRIFCRPELTLFTVRRAAGRLPERG